MIACRSREAIFYTQEANFPWSYPVLARLFDGLSQTLRQVIHVLLTACTPVYLPYCYDFLHTTCMSQARRQRSF